MCNVYPYGEWSPQGIVESYQNCDAKENQWKTIFPENTFSKDNNIGVIGGGWPGLYKCYIGAQ